MNFKKMYEEETLAGSAVTVFASALLVLMAPQWSNRILNLPLNAITAGLVVFSMILALTSVVPPLRSRVFRAVQCLSLSIGIAALVAFIVGWVSGWISVKQVMPSAQWMSWFVLVGGFSLYLLLVYRLVKGHLQRLRRQIMKMVPAAREIPTAIGAAVPCRNRCGPDILAPRGPWIPAFAGKTKMGLAGLFSYQWSAEEDSIPQSPFPRRDACHRIRPEFTAWPLSHMTCNCRSCLEVGRP